jgi:hypothetical protein
VLGAINLSPFLLFLIDLVQWLTVSLLVSSSSRSLTVHVRSVAIWLHNNTLLQLPSLAAPLQERACLLSFLLRSSLTLKPAVLVSWLFLSSRNDAASHYSEPVLNILIFAPLHP